LQLKPLFEGEFCFDETTEVGFPILGQDGDWVSYVQGDGTVRGEALNGTAVWTNHPRRRADGMWLPAFEGVIKPGDGADILFWFRGYNFGVTDPFEYHHRAAVGGLTFAAEDSRYRWLNGIFAVMEADVLPEADPEHWSVRAYECVNDLIGNSDDAHRSSPPADKPSGDAL
jgi:hypothetical protein